MHLFRHTLGLLICGGIVGILLGYLGPLHPAFDTFAHFRLHASLALAGLVCIGFYFRLFLPGVLGLIIAASGLYMASSGTVFSAKTLEADASRPVYSLFHLNLFWISEERQTAIDKIFETDPDLISVTEAAPRWLPFLTQLNEKWPHQFVCTEKSKRGGVRLFSKWPFVDETKHCDSFGAMGKVDVLSPQGKQFTLGSVHLRWPWPASGPRQLKRILPELEKTGPHALFAGDFNATTWSHAVKQFADASGMEIIPGIGPSWLVNELRFPFLWWAGLPIDNVMRKGRVEVLSAKTLEDVGSDHLPVLVRFQIK